jgi:phosphoglycolate phosphatase-like HAD superfamily hydrolase
MPRYKGIIFDFDGVILESVHLKARAFRRLFDAYPQHQDRIVQLHLQQGGLSRYEKFRRIYADFLHLPLSDEEMVRLDTAFSALVAEEMKTCPFVPGARDFIQRRVAECPLFVASGTPQGELRGDVATRGLAPFFVGVYGSPPRKPEIIETVLQQVGAMPSELLFIGDSMPDYEAAAATGVAFAGRVPAGEPNPFPPGPLVLVHDLLELEAWWSAGAAPGSAGHSRG